MKELLENETVEVKIINFNLSSEFANSVCVVKNNGKECPFLECESEKYSCFNFTHEGVMTHRKIRNKSVALESCGCNNVITRILKKKGFFIGKSVEYTDGKNMEDEKILVDIKFDEPKRTLYFMIRGERDILPFPFPVHIDYLSILEFDGILRITNELGSKSSIDILIY